MNTLGDVDLQAWDTYLRSVRDQLVLSWSEAKSAYLTMRQVKETFGLPVVLSPEAAASGQPGWTPGDEQRILNTQAMVELMTTWMDEALAGSRRVGYNDPEGLVLELLSSDPLRIEMQNGVVTIVDAQSGQPVPVDGTISALPAIAWGVGIAAVVAVGVYFTVDAICQAVESTAEEETLRTLGDQQNKLVAAGKATPEQAAQMTAAVYTGAKELTQAKAAVVEQEGSKGIQGTVRTVAWVALGITGLFFLARVLPPIMERPRRPALTGGSPPLLTNPKDPGEDISEHYPFKHKAKLGPGPLGETITRQQDWDCMCENYTCVCHGISDETEGMKKTIHTDPERKAAYNKMYRQWRQEQGG